MATRPSRTDVPVAPFLNVHTRGLDARAGDLLLAPGTRLDAPELAVLASAGLARAEVSTEPRIVICATGDELVAPDQPIADWQVRRSNSYALARRAPAAGLPAGRARTICPTTTRSSRSGSAPTSRRTT